MANGNHYALLIGLWLMQVFILYAQIADKLITIKDGDFTSTQWVLSSDTCDDCNINYDKACTNDTEYGERFCILSDKGTQWNIFLGLTYIVWFSGTYALIEIICPTCGSRLKHKKCTTITSLILHEAFIITAILLWSVGNPVFDEKGKFCINNNCKVQFGMSLILMVLVSVHVVLLLFFLLHYWFCDVLKMNSSISL